MALTPVVVDDRLLVQELLVGLRPHRRRGTLHTTSYWYYRACRAAVAGGAGYLSGPFEREPTEDQAEAVRALLNLREDIGLPDPRVAVPLMARLAQRHPRLNLLNLEATAAAQILDATVWLSAKGAAGVLPRVLNAEGISWRVID